MKRKTYVLVVSAKNQTRKRMRAGFRFTAEPRAVMVTIDRKLAIEADPDLKVYRPKSDHYKRATGAEEIPNSLAKKMNDGQRKLYSSATADTDYPRSEDSIRNELEMMGEEGIEDVAKDLKVKAEKGKDAKPLADVLTELLMELEQEPAEIEPASPEAPEEDEDEETDEDEDEDDSEDADADDADALDEAKVRDRFEELDAMDEPELIDVLEKAGFENEGDKAGKILAILTEEFGEGVEDMELPEVTADDEDAGAAAADDEDEETDEESEDETPEAPQKAGKAPKSDGSGAKPDRHPGTLKASRAAPKNAKGAVARKPKAGTAKKKK